MLPVPLSARSVALSERSEGGHAAKTCAMLMQKAAEQHHATEHEAAHDSHGLTHEVAGRTRGAPLQPSTLHRWSQS